MVLPTFVASRICAILSPQSNRTLIRCMTSSGNLATIYSSLLWNKHVASRVVQNSVGEGCAALRFFRSPGDFAKHGICRIHSWRDQARKMRPLPSRFHANILHFRVFPPTTTLDCLKQIIALSESCDTFPGGCFPSMAWLNDWSIADLRTLLDSHVYKQANNAGISGDSRGDFGV